MSECLQSKEIECATPFIFLIPFSSKVEQPSCDVCISSLLVMFLE